jgi:hypothetical protein
MFNQNSNMLPKAEHDGNLPLLEYKADVYVVKDSCDGTQVFRRVISQRGMFKLMGKSPGIRRDSQYENPYVKFPLAQNIASVHEEIYGENEIIGFPFIDRNETIHYGFEGKQLSKLARSYEVAYQKGILTSNQKHLGQRAQYLCNALMGVGIDALIDEATGFQYHRQSDALQDLLQRYLRDTAAEWKKTFSDEFYEQLYRILNWKHLNPKTQRPGCLGRITNELVYQRILPSLDERLHQKRQSRNEKLHRYLSQEGRQHLEAHLNQLRALLIVSQDWEDLISKVDKVAPKPSEVVGIH